MKSIRAEHQVSESLLSVIPFCVHGGFHHPLVGVWIKHLHVPEVLVAIMASNSINFPYKMMNVKFYLYV